MRVLLAILMCSVLGAAKPACSAPPLKKAAAETAVRKFLDMFLAGRIEAAVEEYVDTEASIKRAFGTEIDGYPAVVQGEAQRLLRLGVVRIFKDVRPFWKEHGIRVSGVESEAPDKDGALVYAIVRRSDGQKDRVPFYVVAPGRIVCVGSGNHGLMPDLARDYEWKANTAISRKTNGFRILLNLAGSKVTLSKTMLVAPESAQTEWSSPDALTLPVHVANVRGAPADVRVAPDALRVVVNLSYRRTFWMRSEAGRGGYQATEGHGDDYDHLKAKVRTRIAAQKDAGVSKSPLRLLARPDRDVYWGSVATLASLAKDDQLGVTSFAIGVRRTGAPSHEKWGRLEIAPAGSLKQPRVEALLRGTYDMDNDMTRYEFSIGTKTLALPELTFNEVVLKDAMIADVQRAIDNLRDEVKATLGQPTPGKSGARLRIQEGQSARVGFVVPLIQMLRELGGGAVELVEEQDDED